MVMTRRQVLGGIAGGALLATTRGAPALAEQQTEVRDIAVHRFRTPTDFTGGAFAGTTSTPAGLGFAEAVGTVTYAGRDYEYATWTSPVIAPGFLATEAIASWTADTPGASWIQVELHGATATGSVTKWYVMGRWAADDGYVQRSSLNGQGDADGTVYTDTFVAAKGGGLLTWQLRVSLYRAVGTSDAPVVRTVGAMASRLPSKDKTTASTPTTALGVTLDVPCYSQEVHAGQYPQWDNGGEAWCSPTSTSMVVAYWGAGPTPADYAWVDPSYADPWVDYAARNTYDYTYAGCGNWPFNTAYAGRFGLDGFVTRLRSMVEVERFIAAGIPLVVSAAFKKNEVPGAGYSTGGHLMVVVGFTASGDPVMNDPFAPTDAGVRKVFGRAEFENAWLTSSGGTVYVIRPASVPLPAAGEQANW